MYLYSTMSASSFSVCHLGGGGCLNTLNPANVSIIQSAQNVKSNKCSHARKSYINLFTKWSTSDCCKVYTSKSKHSPCEEKK